MKTTVSWIGKRQDKPVLLLQGEDRRITVFLNSVNKAAIKSVLGLVGGVRGRRLLDATLEIDVGPKRDIDYIRGKLAPATADRCAFEDSRYYREDDLFVMEC